MDSVDRNVSRRNLLKAGAVGAAALWTDLRAGGAEGDAKKIPIALQLYSVRGDFGKDPSATLAAVGKMGYQGVEFAGYAGKKAAELRKMLDDAGLKCCGTHTGLNTLLGDELKKTIEFNQTLGNKFLIVPGMGQDRLGTAEAIAKTADLFTDLAAKVKDQGMRVGYHAHGGDFKKIEGQTVWDLFFSKAGIDVCMQLDLGNCLDAHGDPYAILKKFPGRTPTIHLKEHDGKPGAVIGEGDVRWKEIFELCETISKTEWYIVEQEGYGALTPLEAAQKCLESLHKMGK